MTSSTQDRSLDPDKLQTLQLWDGAESMKFFSHFFEIVEELKLRRIIDGENEEKINCLIKEKHLLESNFEALKLKLKALEEHQELKSMELSKNYEIQLSDAQKHCAMLDVSFEVGSNEIKSLREEIRELQFLKHSFEKRNRDQERKIQQQNGMLENSFKQLTELDGHFQEVRSKVGSLEEEQSRVAANVRDVIKANIDLARNLEHHQNLLTAHKEEIRQLKSSNMKANVKLRTDKWSENCSKNSVNDTTVALKLDLEALKQTNSILKDKLNTSQENYQRTATLLSDSQNIITHQIAANNKLLAENYLLQKCVAESQEHGMNKQKTQEPSSACSTAIDDEHLDEKRTTDKVLSALKNFVPHTLKCEIFEDQRPQRTSKAELDQSAKNSEIVCTAPDMVPPGGRPIQYRLADSELPKNEVVQRFGLEPTTENLEIIQAVALLSKELNSPETE